MNKNDPKSGSEKCTEDYIDPIIMLQRNPTGLGRSRAAAPRNRVNASRHIALRTASATLDDIQLVAEAPESITQDADTAAPHPSLPYLPAFKVQDIVYGTNVFCNAKGARVDIMYHQGLVG